MKAQQRPKTKHQHTVTSAPQGQRQLFSTRYSIIIPAHRTKPIVTELQSIIHHEVHFAPEPPIPNQNLNIPQRGRTA